MVNDMADKKPKVVRMRTAAASIPRGIEVLVKKAAVDPAFRALLLEKRAAAAESIGLRLDPTEVTMLASIPEAQLSAIIAGTKVAPGISKAFLGYAATVMLAALGCDAHTAGSDEVVTKGITPDTEYPANASRQHPPGDGQPQRQSDRPAG